MMLTTVHHQIWVKLIHDAIWDVMGEVQIGWGTDSFFPRLAPFRSHPGLLNFVNAPQLSQAELAVSNIENAEANRGGTDATSQSHNQ